MRTLSVRPSNEWADVLRRVHQHDIYFLPSYHALAEARGEGEARLYTYTEGEYLLALPLLLRPLDAVPALGAAGAGWFDATSVYGYAGPLASHATVPAAVVARFQTELRATLTEHGVIAAFSRLHPFLPQKALLEGLGDLVPRGRTVSIDLARPGEEIRNDFRGNHRRAIIKLRKDGFTCVRNEGRSRFAEFVAIYHENMRRVGATEGYFFDAYYYDQMANGFGEQVQLFLVEHGGEVACAALFMLCDGIVQFHLGGTADRHLRSAPMKLVVDEVITWAQSVGGKVLHLGGGRGAEEDSLFQFKAGFSDRRHDFGTWQWVLSPNTYDDLSRRADEWHARHERFIQATDYFPYYRAPGQAAVAEAAAVA